MKYIADTHIERYLKQGYAKRVSGLIHLSHWTEGIGCKIYIENKDFEILEEVDGMVLMDCEDCNGDGYQEELHCTVGSASLCCGGCYRNVPCDNDECFEGKVEVEIDPSVPKFYWNLRKFTKGEYHAI